MKLSDFGLCKPIVPGKLPPLPHILEEAIASDETDDAAAANSNRNQAEVRVRRCGCAVVG